MVSVSTLQQLEQLRPGDRITYHGVQWDVKDYSSYTDAKGYQTEEWLLHSQKGSEYYLLREVDPENSEKLVNWYLAQQINKPTIFLPNSAENIISNLWHLMQQEDATPYPEIKIFSHSYYFESVTRGMYQSEAEETTRITWDYWDRDHYKNLAIEVWPTGEILVYLTTKVKPEEFYNIQKGVGKKLPPFPWVSVLLSLSLIIFGILLLIN